LISISFKLHLEILSHFYIMFTIFYYKTSRTRFFITTFFHSVVHFVPVPIKGLYQIESYGLHVMQ